ncbi:MAG: efflux RND transporter periplasmic adaptor subunit [Verrucomicrobiales bacterium]
MNPHSLIPLVLTCCLQGLVLADDASIETYLRPIQEIDLASAELGILQTIHVKPGDHVIKGQEILRLNSSVIEAQLAQAEVQATQDGRLKSVEAEQGIAKQRLAIIESLRERGNTNEAEWTKAVASLAVAEGQLKAAQEDRDTLRLQAATIRAQLDLRILRSPIEGIVVEVTRDVGESVTARGGDIPDYLVKIVDLTRLISRAHIPARLAENLRKGQAIGVTLEDSQKTQSQGSIDFVAPTVDAVTGLTEVHIIFDNANGNLRSGIPATLRIPAPD